MDDNEEVRSTVILRIATKSDLPAIVTLKAAMFAEAGRVHLLADRFAEQVLSDYERLYDDW